MVMIASTCSPVLLWLFRYFFVEGAARRIHAMMPHARMLCLLRNPVDRHLSHIDTKFRMQMNGSVIY